MTLKTAKNPARVMRSVTSRTISSQLSGSNGAIFPEASSSFGTVAELGRTLFTDFFYPFEAISLLLIVAMVGAVLLAKRRL